MVGCALLLQGTGRAGPTILLPAERPVVHPRIAADPANAKAAIQGRLLRDPAAKAALDRLRDEVAVHVARHRTDPTWMVSRLQMYWQSRASEVFIRGGVFDHAGGEPAPVPTVRFPGARDATTIYGTPRLEDIPPYSEDPRGVLLINRETNAPEWAAPAKTGRVIESINTTIMRLAETAALVGWVTGEEDYTRFAADLFDAYMMGMHYRKVPQDLTRGHHQTIAGLSTFEVIQERILPGLATTYDFLHDALRARSPEKLPVYEATFKQWIDLTISNGVPFNNWNLIEARFVLAVAAVLGNDRDYPDGRGAQHYFDQVVNRSSLRQWSLFDLLERGFDAETGIWNECPGYALGVVGDFATLVPTLDEMFQVDLAPHAPVIAKSVFATAQYLYPNGYTVGYGDSHHGHVNPGAARALAGHARRHGRTDEERAFLRYSKMLDELNGSRGGGRGRGSDSDRGREAIFVRSAYMPDETLAAGTLADYVSPTFWAPNASYFVQRNGLDPQTGLMIAHHGSKGNHMHANGVAVELYGRGLVLAPSSGIGTSYFQPDYHEYYSQFPAHNTVVVDGISAHPVMRANHGLNLLGCYPAPGVKTGVFPTVTFSDLHFLEPETNADQRRVTSIVRTGERTGYYVDIFRSRRKDGADRKHDYFYHNLGQRLSLAGADGSELALRPTDKLAFADGDLFAYDYLWDKKSVKTDRDYRATFTLSVPGHDDVLMQMWMKGAPGREIFAVKSPRSRAIDRGMVPADIAALPLPTIVAQQPGEAWTRPFVAVFEPTTQSEPSSIATISSFAPAGGPADFVGLTIEGKAGDRQHVFSATAVAGEITHAGKAFRGLYAVIGESHGMTQYLFLGQGRRIANADADIVASSDGAAAAFARQGSGWTFTASVPATLTLSRSLLGGATMIRLGLEVHRGREAPDRPGFRTFDLPATPLVPVSW